VWILQEPGFAARAHLPRIGGTPRVPLSLAAPARGTDTRARAPAGGPGSVRFAPVDSLRAWIRRHLADPQVVLLVVLLVGGLALVVLLGRFLAPFIAALVVAYILDAPLRALTRRGVPHLIAVVIVFVSFFVLTVVATFAVLPLVSSQLAQLVVLLPSMLGQVQELLLRLPDEYPNLVDARQIEEVLEAIRTEVLALGQTLLEFSLASIGSLVTLVAYVFLVPFLVFFLLKDRDRLMAWLVGFLPPQRDLVRHVWRDVDRQIGAYVRGKIYEIGIVTAVTWLCFQALGVNLALLLAVLTGLSVLIPYVGVAVVSIPVTLVALFQFGVDGQMAAVLGAYALIQTIDGNVLAPLVISETVDLHPVAVIVAILIFGGIWGFWGVFFAIPLATVVTAVLNAWPGAPPADAGAGAGGPAPAPEDPEARG